MAEQKDDKQEDLHGLIFDGPVGPTPLQQQAQVLRSRLGSFRGRLNVLKEKVRERARRHTR